MERRAEELFAQIEELGDGSMLDGAIRGVEEGWYQGEIADSAYELERKLNSGRARRRRRQRVPRGQRRTAAADPAHRSRGRRGTAPPARQGEARARLRRGRRRARPRPGRGRRTRRQPDARVHRRGARRTRRSARSSTRSPTCSAAGSRPPGSNARSSVRRSTASRASVTSRNTHSSP